MFVREVETFYIKKIVGDTNDILILPRAYQRAERLNAEQAEIQHPHLARTRT